MKRILPAIAFLLLLTPQLIAAETAGSVPDETPEQRDARMAWWREARFGMFIHWGVYSVPAGTYHGKQIGGIGEWIMRSAQIPVAEYRSYAKDFNPVKFDPHAWAALAEEAGMRYIVITSKHHDGFALFPSEVTDWDIADASPYGKDLIGPLIQLRPGLITNNRLGGGYAGDTDTPEQHIPATGIKGRDWETCMTLNIGSTRPTRPNGTSS